MPVILLSLVAGVIFGAGLAVSDMINPARVLNFFDVAGAGIQPFLRDGRRVGRHGCRLPVDVRARPPSDGRNVNLPKLTKSTPR